MISRYATLIRIVLGLGATAVGAIALFSFALLSDRLRVFSPDGIIDPYMLLEARVVLAGLLPIGLILLLWTFLKSTLSRLNVFLQSLGYRKWLLSLISASLLLRLIAFLTIPVHLIIDYQAYDELAWTWAQQGDYINAGQLTGYWPPGYPWFLSRVYYLFGHSPIAGAAVNILLSLAIVLLSYYLARRVFSEPIARWTGLIMAFFPSQLFFVNLLASEMVFAPLFLTALLLLANHRRWERLEGITVLMAGICLGLAALCRALAQPFWVVLVPYFYATTRSWPRTLRNTFLLVLGMAVVITPWVLRNQDAVGRAAISTNGGINLMIGNHALSGMGWNSVDTVEFNTNDPSREAWIDSVGFARGRDYIVKHPLQFVRRGFLKVAYTFAADVVGLMYELRAAARNDSTDGFVLLAIASQAYYYLVLIGAFLGLLVACRTQRSPASFLILSPILFWIVVHFVFFGHGRFHFPVMPMVAAIAAVFIVDIANRRSV